MELNKSGIARGWIFLHAAGEPVGCRSTVAGTHHNEDLLSGAAAKTTEHHDIPPCFHYMERGNLAGAEAVPASLLPRPVTAWKKEGSETEDAA